MDKELFSSMREQMRPGEDVRAALAEKLAAPQKKRVPVGRYAAIAACAAVIVAAVPVYRAVSEHLKWQVLLDTFHHDAVVKPLEPHSYVLVGPFTLTEDTAVRENSTAGSGDEDQNMTPGELAVNTEELPAGLPGKPPISVVPDQSGAVMAYQNLMAQFEADYGPGRYPDWYVGAYIDDSGVLIVNITEDCAADKDLEQQIQDWAGSSKIGFSSGSRLSLNELRELQDKVVEALDGLGLMNWGCGVNEETGQVELTLPKVTREALLRLAALDPEGTAILVIVGEVMIEDLAEEPVQVAPSVSHSVQPGGDPNTPVSETPGVIVDEDGVIAWEPQG